MYLWIGLILEEELAKQIREICKKVNKDYLLNENVFALPQHISLKTSFPADNYKEIISYVKTLLHQENSVSLELYNMTKINNSLIWLDTKENDVLRNLHNVLNEKLKERFNVILNGFDGDSFIFHTTLFQDETINDEHENMLCEIGKELSLPIKSLATKVAFGLSEGGKPGTYKIIDYMDLNKV